MPRSRTASIRRCSTSPPAFTNPALDNWNGLGIAVQAYGKRAIPVLRWLRRLAERAGKRIPVRLVKGAYWDSEIKWAQERGLADYPVFTRKLNTDVSYLACVRLLLSDAKAFYPQFATHNAHALAAAHVAGGSAVFEFQRLHGMGEALYEEVVGEGMIGRPCRIYAPVGGHEDLLGYLVRRLLENGANTSFVNRLADEEAPVADIIRDPVEAAERERGAHDRPAHSAPARHLPAGAQGRERAGAQRSRRCATSCLRRWPPRSTTRSRPAPSSPERRRRAAIRRASSPARTTGASASAPCASPRQSRPTPRSNAPRAPSTPGTASAVRAAPRSWRRRPICSSATARA